jgi:hypothetical protein
MRYAGLLLFQKTFFKLTATGKHRIDAEEIRAD